MLLMLQILWTRFYGCALPSRVLKDSSSEPGMKEPGMKEVFYEAHQISHHSAITLCLPTLLVQYNITIQEKIPAAFENLHLHVNLYGPGADLMRPYLGYCRY
eukprot:Gregarina_sp_Poly_1__101@NODE_1021_length_5328_cov_19_525375_g712_i0_p4_GENE_NODE_1021_length_5328_cov_19_525375_g712_i0NODE_1021_length_5328_cov_19_525375_g712_i0_p4_ORF_typecomplete_len102_score5_31_NODE_1021_length_5328_cov_19_525375_g712_i049925297